jgi:hypothetical protein
MSFDKSFCPSPWFHMRINNSGTYSYCRWAAGSASIVDPVTNIKQQSPLDYFNGGMTEIRRSLLQGESPDSCRECHLQEEHGKVSGRLRQLLKVGIMTDCFEPSLASSPYRPAFDYSAGNNGKTECTPVDWQIDLGNYCNSACVMCYPEASSTIATEYKKLGLITQVPPNSWCNDPVLLEKFITDLVRSPNIKYLHFIGGETLITPGFKQILSALVDCCLAKDITVGFTTNLTVWDDSVVELLSKFATVNLGLSIEALDPVNDYVRYPSKLTTTRTLLDRWVALGKELHWLIQLRITPTCLTVGKLHTVYEYAYVNHLAVESCNFIERPEFLRISVLPKEYRQQAIDSLTHWIGDKVAATEQVVNTRDPSLAHSQVIQDATSYINYLENAPEESWRLPDLVDYLTLLERNRGNSIIKYLPEYEELLRTNGYTVNS